MDILIYSDGSDSVKKTYSTKEQIRKWVEFVKEKQLRIIIFQVNIIFLYDGGAMTGTALINLN